MTVQGDGTEKNGNSSHSSCFYSPPAAGGSSENRLRQYLIEKTGAQIDNDYHSLHEWSCKNHALFWHHFATFAKIKFSKEAKMAVDPNASIADFPEWFPGATLNYAENCLVGRAPDDTPAFVTAYNATEMVLRTRGELRRDVERLATVLRDELGVRPGEAVCGFLPNSYETAVAMFAAAAIGAVWSSASVDFGPQGVHDRFSQVEPKVLFIVDAVKYKSKQFDLHDKINTIVSGLPTIERIILFNLRPCDGEERGDHAFAKEVREKLMKYEEIQAKSPDSSKPFQYEQMPFKHPLFIMFSSGTTGAPKAIVHSAGGTLLKHVEEHLIQEDASPADRILFYTTCGWMMWNWLMTFIYTGGSIVAFEESPLEPDPHILIKIAAKTGSTIFGACAKLYDEYTKMGVDFKAHYKLNLRMILSTGSPLKASSFNFINDHIAPQAVIGSISGGTDIIGCFMGASVSLPVVPGECQCLYLGMDIKAFDDDAKPVYGEQGELVCLTPFPSMPTHYLNDPSRSKYKAAYFDRFPGVWAHGDFCLISSETKGVIMLGRSDATLNRGGVRIGTADIYSVVDQFPEVADSIVAGQNVPETEDESIVLFVKMRQPSELNDDLKRRICSEIRRLMSPRHIPNFIHAVTDIPYTNSGKKVELAVKKIINGAPVKNVSALCNPDSLALYRKFAVSEESQ